jgi:hypothetical protein
MTRTCARLRAIPPDRRSPSQYRTTRQNDIAPASRRAISAHMCSWSPTHRTRVRMVDVAHAEITTRHDSYTSAWSSFIQFWGRRSRITPFRLRPRRSPEAPTTRRGDGGSSDRGGSDGQVAMPPSQRPARGPSCCDTHKTIGPRSVCRTAPTGTAGRIGKSERAGSLVERCNQRLEPLDRTSPYSRGSFRDRSQPSGSSAARDKVQTPSRHDGGERPRAISKEHLSADLYSGPRTERWYITSRGSP